MELETESQPTSSDISDEMRLAAATKQVVVTPLHADVTPDAPSEASIVNKPVVDTPIANLPSDSETTRAVTPPVEAVAQPLAAPGAQKRWVIAGSSIGFACATLLVIYIAIRHK